MSKKKLSESCCPLCHGLKFEPGRLGLLNCVRCDLTVSPDIWQPQANETLEEEWFGETYQPQTSFWVRWFETWNNRRTLGRLAGIQSSSRHLLEIGIGSGSFLQSAREQGFEVMGCDLSRAICERVTRMHGIAMHCGPLSELEGQERFDVVVMNHVLEHVNDPVAFLRDVQRLIVPGGMAHVAVPNVACWEARLSGWTSYEPYHLAYFTPDTLHQTVVAGGFVVEREATHESFSGWFLALLRTVLGVNRDGQTVQPNVRTARVVTGRSRPMLAEHAYRLAMVCTGGAVAATFTSGKTWTRRRGHLHRPQTLCCFGTVRIYGD